MPMNKRIKVDLGTVKFQKQRNREKEVTDPIPLWTGGQWHCGRAPSIPSPPYTYSHRDKQSSISLSNAYFHTFQLDHHRRANGSTEQPTDKATYAVASSQLKRDVAKKTNCERKRKKAKLREKEHCLTAGVNSPRCLCKLGSQLCCSFPSLSFSKKGQS